MAKVKKITMNEVACDHCPATIQTEKSSGKIQCFACGKRTELDG